MADSRVTFVRSTETMVYFTHYHTIALFPCRSQCADIWDVLANHADPNDTITHETINAQKRMYQIINLSIMFYIPTGAL